MENKIQQFKQLVNKCDNIVFFGGAGVSTESGIPDFRSKDGLYNQQYKYPPETILSHTFFMNKTEEFFKFYDAEYVFNSNGIPRCNCGGIIKPDVVLYAEGLDEETIENSTAAIQKADLLIVAGTSLTVQPASGLINFFRGRNLVLINRDSTPYDNKANLVINDSLGKVFSNL